MAARRFPVPLFPGRWRTGTKSSNKHVCQTQWVILIVAILRTRPDSNAILISESNSPIDTFPKCMETLRIDGTELGTVLPVATHENMHAPPYERADSIGSKQHSAACYLDALNYKEPPKPTAFPKTREYLGSLTPAQYTNLTSPPLPHTHHHRYT